MMTTDTMGTTGTGTSGTTTTGTTTTTSTSSSNAYAPSEGDVSRSNGKVVVYRNGQWTSTTSDVRLDNGATVNSNGRITYNGQDRDLEEGEHVTKAGRFFDKAGNGIENAWDATKSGVKKGAKAVGNAAEKVGSKVKDAVTNDNKDN
ncbi:MAG: hypothetical protein EOO16_09130 [Chitinophagaceae bacterium]|nr:MAG: hypothetical protein EOO16_09130 [Chitinophagaceae bacterium]